MALLPPILVFRPCTFGEDQLVFSLDTMGSDHFVLAMGKPKASSKSLINFTFQPSNHASVSKIFSADSGTYFRKTVRW